MRNLRRPTSAAWRRTACLASLIACLVGSASAAVDYPLELTFDASLKTEAATITSSVTIHLDRLMEESRRKRVTDALAHGGYGNFLPALRGLPPIGTIVLNKKTVEIRYAREESEGAGRRL